MATSARQPALSARSAARAVRGLALSCHPIPSLAVTVITAGLAAQAGTTVTRGSLVTLAMFAGQLSIGWCNDAIDADRDRAVHRTDKPVAAGAISKRTTILAAGLSVFIMVTCSFPLGGKVTAIVVGSVACGWAYDLGLKATSWSWLPYSLAFGALPAVATMSSVHPRWPATWAMTASALFGVAAHFANVLPDLRDDQATGVRGLPHRLGGNATALIGPALLVLASAVITLGPPDHRVLRACGLAITAVVACWASYAARKDPESSRYFMAVIALAGLDLLLFALSGSSI